MPKPDRLVQVWRSGHGLPFPFYRDVTGSQRSFDSLSLGGWDFLDLGRGEHPERVTAIYVTPEIFRVTAEPMVLGRFYAEDEDRHGGPPVVVLSEQLWREKFDGGPNIVGKTIVLSDQTFEIIGVCHRQVESFFYALPESPLCSASCWRALRRRFNEACWFWLPVLREITGRRQPSAS
jgi:MacB-like periplasmic core domain